MSMTTFIVLGRTFPMRLFITWKKKTRRSW